MTQGTVLSDPARLIDLRTAGAGPAWSRPLLRLLGSGLERPLGLPALNAGYAELRRRVRVEGEERLFDIALDILGVDYDTEPEALRRVPAEGGLVVVTNHPFGGLEGLVLAHLLLRVRPDVRIFGNHLLQRVEPLRPWLISVDPFGHREAAGRNGLALRSAIRWVGDGGALLTFPAGEVSHLHVRHGRVTDAPWKPGVGVILRRTGAQVLPIHVHGRNSILFQTAGMLHPQLRTALLPRELLNKHRSRLRLSIGSPLSPERWAADATPAATVAALQARTELLGLRTPPLADLGRGPRLAGATGDRAAMPIAAAGDPGAAAAEIAALPPDSLLAHSGSLRVHITDAGAVPALMHEVGRWREHTFRAAGEGTGRALDLDRFDVGYRHLLLWDEERGELAGGYRLGFVDELLPAGGPRALYTSTLFRYRPPIWRHLQHGIELGRSFIRPEYQRHPAALSLLWRGIGQLVAARPEHAVLFGPVSISRDYGVAARDLMVQFLRWHRIDTELARWVRPRRPYHPARRRLGALQGILRDIDELAAAVSDLEDGAREVPILLRQYLRLNAVVLGFNVDPDFADVVDCLIVVDLRRTDPRLLRRFMGAEGLKAFQAYHTHDGDPADADVTGSGRFGKAAARHGAVTRALRRLHTAALDCPAS